MRAWNSTSKTARSRSSGVRPGGEQAVGPLLLAASQEGQDRQVLGGKGLGHAASVGLLVVAGQPQDVQTGLYLVDREAHAVETTAVVRATWP